MRIEELMTRDVETCRPEDSLERAAQIMWERDVGCAPVVRADSELVGMLTDRDICMAAYTRGKPLVECRVQDAMTASLHTCSPDDDVATVEAEMRRAQVRRMPVVNGGRLMGLITLNDLALSASHRRGNVGFDEIGKTLAGICQHRNRPETLARVS